MGVRGLVAQGITPTADLKSSIEDQRLLNILVSRVNALAQQVVFAGSNVAENLPRGNALLLLAGSQRPWTLSTPLAVISGQPGANSTKATFRNSAMCNGGEFSGVVTLAKNAVVVFNGCLFNAPNLDAQVVCADGAQAVFIGCMFAGADVGQVVDNPGATGNIRWVGCFNLTGAADGNVTVVG